MGVIAKSAPRLKSPIPSTRNKAETAKTTISCTVKPIKGNSISTIAVTGKTDINDSFNLANNIFRIYLYHII